MDKLTVEIRFGVKKITNESKNLFNSDNIK